MTNNERIEIEIMGTKVAHKGYLKKQFNTYTFENTEGGPDRFAWDFEHRLEWCHIMEEKIKEKGWEEEYAEKLEDLLREKGFKMSLKENVRGSVLRQFFSFAHASPEDRVSAAIRMLDEMRGK